MNMSLCEKCGSNRDGENYNFHYGGKISQKTYVQSGTSVVHTTISTYRILGVGDAFICHTCSRKSAIVWIILPLFITLVPWLILLVIRFFRVLHFNPMYIIGFATIICLPILYGWVWTVFRNDINIPELLYGSVFILYFVTLFIYIAMNFKPGYILYRAYLVIYYFGIPLLCLLLILTMILAYVRRDGYCETLAWHLKKESFSEAYPNLELKGWNRWQFKNLRKR